jgi:flagellin-like protein
MREPLRRDKKKMKILKSRKALSPVVASIILIAVTVAVSIAVAAWMGALSFGFMGTEQLTITKLTWDHTNKGFNMTVANTGTKDVTIAQVQVNYAKQTVIQELPYTLKTGATIELDVNFNFSNGTAYDISVVSSSGYKFTGNFIGGQDKE